MTDNIKEIFDQFSRLKVLVVGDAMIDRYWYGRVDRISPEAPVPIVQLQNEQARLGGAANVAMNISALGATPFLVCLVGEDVFGKQFEQLLEDEDLSSEGLICDPDRQTTVKSRIIAGQQHLLRLDQENTHLLSSTIEEKVFEKCNAIIRNKQIDLILFQDYNKGLLKPSLIKRLIKLAQQNEIPTAVDPKFDHFFDYKGVTLLKPNLKEVSQAVGNIVEANVVDLEKAISLIQQQMNHKISLITLSDHGVFIKGDNVGEIIPTTPRQIVDVCGAGDSVFSIASMGMVLHLDLDVIGRLANLAGGQVCERVGVVTINGEQLKEEWALRLLH